MIVDEQFHQGSQSYKVQQIHHLDGHVLRVRVQRDFYQTQSHAVVEVLTASLDWTPLTFTSPNIWHAQTPTDASNAKPLRPIAGELTYRAQCILAPVTAPAPRSAPARASGRRSPA